MRRATPWALRHGRFSVRMSRRMLCQAPLRERSCIEQPGCQAADVRPHGSSGCLQGTHRSLNTMRRIWAGWSLDTREKGGREGPAPTFGIITALPHEYAAVEIL